jgi:cystathionine gamma-synthase
MSLSDETLCSQGLGWIEETYSCITPSIYPSTTYARNPDLTYPQNRIYTRADNPTYDQFSELIKQLEKGASSRLFASGMAAAVAVFQALQSGDCVIFPKQVYSGIRTWVETNFKKFNIRYEYVRNNDLKELQIALEKSKPKMVWLETPSNPELIITDLKSAIALAHSYGAMVVVDNTLATPVLTKPVENGADIVLHSATKYLCGHGDVLAGVLITREENDFWRNIEQIAHDGGALPGPFEVWLLLRGIRTLYLRMERICSNAQTIAEHFSNCKGVEKVLYPRLKDSEGYETAKIQMNGKFGGIISLIVSGGKAKAIEVQGKVKVFKRATSLGTVESLIEHRASYEGPGTKVPDNLLRLSIGIERVEDLICDLEQALV